MQDNYINHHSVLSFLLKTCDALYCHVDLYSTFEEIVYKNHFVNERIPYGQKLSRRAYEKGNIGVFRMKHNFPLKGSAYIYRRSFSQHASRRWSFSSYTYNTKALTRFAHFTYKSIRITKEIKNRIHRLIVSCIDIEKLSRSVIANYNFIVAATEYKDIGTKKKSYGI